MTARHDFTAGCHCERCILIATERIAWEYEREQRDMLPMTIDHKWGQSCRARVRNLTERERNLMRRPA